LGSHAVHKFLTDDVEKLTGGKFFFEPDPIKAAAQIIEHLDQKRAELKLAPPMYTAKATFQGVAVGV
jgi:carbon-monoxide dehydrogenase catalytic subunit